MTAPKDRTEEYLLNTPLNDEGKKIFYDILQSLQKNQCMEIDYDGDTLAIYYLHVDDDLNVVIDDINLEDNTLLPGYMYLPEPCTAETLSDWEYDYDSYYFVFLDMVLDLTRELLKRREARKKEDF